MEDAHFSQRSARRSIIHELLSLLKDSIPGLSFAPTPLTTNPLTPASSVVVFSYTLQNSICTAAVLVAGRLGPAELSVAAFSLMLATALDTLGSQAFTGGVHPADLSVLFLRCVAMLWLLFVPIAVMWANMEPILLALGQEPYIAQGTQTFLRLLIVGVPGYIGFESLKKYLQCQGIMDASTLVLIVVSPINVVFNIVLVHYTPLGLYGTPLAVSATFWLAFALLAVYAAFSPTHARNKTWGGLRLRAAFSARGCLLFLRLALPGILMVGTEWAAFEIVALAAGRLGSTALAAQSVIMTSDQILNTIPFGIGVAASTRVGSLIGARSAHGARFAGHMSALMSVLVGAVVMLALLATKDVFGYVFSDDEDVVRLVARVMPLLASFQIADGLAGSCGGVLRGQGRQHLGALFNVVAYYVLALPIGISLAFKYALGLPGLWIGQVVALFIVGFAEYGVVWLGTDWEGEVRKGIERNRAEAMRQMAFVEDAETLCEGAE
ncbi:mate-domain-containing protein [Vararia minispora EC-137]|uniref:Mate-domain-containing protein n=1 Tax=Vararia minispora EC-137 TaxID=1314806 RepID=A0ACB8QT13_9AGAM|nr:mate-domain-containing protein [Vararia minispora EC-137]